MWEGLEERQPQDDDLDAFMAQLYDNRIPVAFPAEIEYKPNDWRTRVNASLMYVRDLYGDPVLTTYEFDIDEIVPEFDAPRRVRF